MFKLEEWLYDEESSTKQLRIATTAMKCGRDLSDNRNRLSNNVHQIMNEHPDTELILFGEMISGWYNPQEMTRGDHDVSEGIPGTTTNLLGDLSKKHGIFLSCGLSEKTNTGYHNTQVLVNPQGEIQAIHRKWNLKPDEHQAGYLPGPQPVTATEIKGVKVGMIICSDAAHPGTMKELLRTNVDLILFSLADDRDEKWFVAKTLARLYDAWIVSANRYGQEHHYWNGHTIISDPLGRLQKVSTDQEGYLVHTLQIATDRSGTQRFLRNVYVKFPLLVHILKNWRILKSYYQS